jgi:hypothetical protein
MTTTTRITRSGLAAVGLIAAAIGTGGAALASTAPPGSDRAEAVAYEVPGGTASEEFCAGLVDAQLAIEGESPEDPAEFEVYVAERIEPNLQRFEANAPDDLAEAAATMNAAARKVLATDDFAAFENPEYVEAASAVFSTLDETCGFPVLDVLARDFSFGGIPDELSTGVTVFAIINDSEAGEGHEFVMAKLRDDADVTVEDLLVMSDEESDQYIERFGGGTFSAAGTTTYVLSVLTPAAGCTRASCRWAASATRRGPAPLMPWRGWPASSRWPDPRRDERWPRHRDHR